MYDTQSFAPLYSPSAGTGAGSWIASVTITASATAASAFLPGSAGVANAAVQIQIANKTTAWAHINMGNLAGVTAATVAAGYPVAPGGVVVVSVPDEVCQVSVILDAAPGTETGVVFTRGAGI
jgi:hypothetical protein